MDALTTLVDQLWGPGADGDVRVRLATVPTPPDEVGWATAEEYWVLPNAAAPRLLVPVSSPKVQRAALTQYRGLRRATGNVGRALAGALAGTPAPLSRHRIVVRTRGAQATAGLPLSRLADELDVPGLTATFGVRTGANRKATLHLLAPDGETVGYAKLGWNSTADAYVRTETKVLQRIGGRPAAMRAPSVLASFDHGGRPVVVVSPLPPDVRGVRGALAPPTSAELFALCPLDGAGRASRSSHLQALHASLSDLRRAPDAVPAIAAATALADLVAVDDREVPLQERWHGDLTPWNCARQPDGQLWAWDWESSAEDVVAGLDALHWAFSVAREAGRLSTVTLAECLASAAPHLVSAGVSSSSQPVVAAVYALTVVERAATLAAQEGDWSRVWITPERLTALVAEARTLLTP